MFWESLYNINQGKRKGSCVVKVSSKEFCHKTVSVGIHIIHTMSGGVTPRSGSSLLLKGVTEGTSRVGRNFI